MRSTSVTHAWAPKLDKIPVFMTMRLDRERLQPVGR